MDKALAESCNKIDGPAIKAIYGDLASDNLTQLITEVLSQVSDRVKAEFDTILDSHDVNNKMLRLDELIAEASGETVPDNKAAPPVFSDLLPNGVTPADVLRLHAYEMKTAEKARILAELAAVDASSSEISKEIASETKNIQSKLEVIEEQRRRMQQTADLCAMSN
jgi:hypothetical protein